MEASAAPARRWEMRWCSSDWVRLGVGMQTEWAWAPSDRPARAQQRITRGRTLAQLREQTSPDENFLTTRSAAPLETSQPQLANHGRCVRKQIETKSRQSMTQQLPNIQEDDELSIEELAEEENVPPAYDEDNAIAALWRSGRERKPPHVRRESSGMVDSSLLHRSLSAGKASSSKPHTNGDGGTAVAPLRRSGRERKLPHVRRESSGMVDSSLVYRALPGNKSGDSAAKAVPASAADVELLTQRGTAD